MDAELADARPQPGIDGGNAFKIPLLARTVVATLRDLPTGGASMTDLLEPRAIGRDLVRRDGALKVRGTATYAFETPVDIPAYCQPVQATVARGRITSIDTADAEALDGVLAVLTTRNAERLAVHRATPSSPSCRATRSPSAASSSACVVARDLRGRPPGRRPRPGHATTSSRTTSRSRADRADLYKPDKVNPSLPDRHRPRATCAAAMAAAPATVEQTYTTAMYHNNPLEPHATTALWDATGAGFAHALGLHPGRAPGPRGRRDDVRAAARAGAGDVARTSAAASARRARRTPTSCSPRWRPAPCPAGR